MPTLLDFKKRFVAGQPVTVEFSGLTIRGNLGDTVIPARKVTRKVFQATAGGVYFEAEAPKTGRGSFLCWPKASCLTHVDANTVAVSLDPGEKPFATYHFSS